MYSIVIPYLSNSKYIDDCKKYLRLNSKYPHEIVDIVDETDVYYAFNSGVYKAKYDKVILLSDDMFVSKNWDDNFLKYISEDTVVTCNVVEPDPGGGVYRPFTNEHVLNIKYDCGDTLSVFDYEKFQTFVDSQTEPEVIHGAKGWYMPVGFHKKSYVGYPNIAKFPQSPNDIILLDVILPNVGYKFAKVNSFVYHFQRRSQVIEP
jgi:hypothetical protein